MRLRGPAVAAFLTLCAALLVASGPAALAKGPKAGYIVVLRDAVDHPAEVAREHKKLFDVDVTNVYGKALKGYAAKIDGAELGAVRADPRVAFVERDARVHIDSNQSPATWGLDRIDQRNLPLNDTYGYNRTGDGVTAYVIDTGILTTHAQFGPRAKDGVDEVDGSLPAADCNGHGTHVAGTIGGSTYGVAKDVKLVAVRVLDCSGSGWWSWVIAGINWAIVDHPAGQPAVANMSLGGGASSAVDAAVRNAIADGITFAVAAGNSNQDACKSSPSRVTEALTVGATTSSDAKASYSNWGKCVDVFAPGSSITSSWSSSNTATNTISGTSMATPHVAGVAALILQGGYQSPAAIASKIVGDATGGAVKGITKGMRGTLNRLLFEDY